jgi:hypothetical protein
MVRVQLLHPVTTPIAPRWCAGCTPVGLRGAANPTSTAQYGTLLSGQRGRGHQVPAPRLSPLLPLLTLGERGLDPVPQRG